MTKWIIRVFIIISLPAWIFISQPIATILCVAEFHENPIKVYFRLFSYYKEAFRKGNLTP